MGATPVSPAGENTIRINVESGSIASGDWQYSVSSGQGSYNWTDGTEKLDPPYVELGEFSSGVYYVSLKHKPSGHLYFSDETVQV